MGRKVSSIIAGIDNLTIVEERPLTNELVFKIVNRRLINHLCDVFYADPVNRNAPGKSQKYYEKPEKTSPFEFVTLRCSNAETVSAIKTYIIHIKINRSLPSPSNFPESSLRLSPSSSLRPIASAGASSSTRLRLRLRLRSSAGASAGASASSSARASSSASASASASSSASLGPNPRISSADSDGPPKRRRLDPNEKKPPNSVYLFLQLCSLTKLYVELQSINEDFYNTTKDVFPRLEIYTELWEKLPIPLKFIDNTFEIINKSYENFLKTDPPSPQNVDEIIKNSIDKMSEFRQNYSTSIQMLLNRISGYNDKNGEVPLLRVLYNALESHKQEARDCFPKPGELTDPNILKTKLSELPELRGVAV